MFVSGVKVVLPGGYMVLAQRIPWCLGGSISSVVWLPGWLDVWVSLRRRDIMSGDTPTYATIMWLAPASGMFQDRWALANLRGWPPSVIWEVMQVQLGGTWFRG